MNAQDIEGLQSLIRKAVTNSIMEGKDSVVLYEDKGNGTAMIVNMDSLRSILAEDPKAEYILLCTIRADGSVEASDGDTVIKHKRI